MATASPLPMHQVTDAPMAYAFITWDAALGRRMCPLATFGSRAPLVHSTRLVCVDPPRADRESLANAADVRGSIALVVRGGCSFVEKARRIQSAGAVAMILANNTREEPFAMFTMAADGEDTSNVTMPCVMMCLYDVRELFKQFPPSVKTGVLTLEIHAPERELELVTECESQRLLAMQQHAKDGSANGSVHPAQESSGWGAALKRKTTSLIKRWESTPTTSESPTTVPTQSTVEPQTATPATPQPIPKLLPSPSPVEIKPKAPLFAFVQWPTSASTFVMFFAPIADFCLVANGAIYEGRSVVCDPLLAHQDPIRNASELVDAIALVQRGACTFPAKLERVQRCGAAAVIVGNDDAQDEDAAFVMSVDHIKVDHVTIPAVMVSKRVFSRLREQDKPTMLRILCLSGEAAMQCLARAGQELSITEIPMPQVEKPTKPSADVEATTEGGNEVTANDSADEQESAAAEPSELDPVTRLHLACRAGDHGGCQRVLDEACGNESSRRELVMATDQFQLTALHHACAANQDHAGVEHVVALLLRYGASPTARDMVLNTPLHLACLRGHAASVKKLLSTASSAVISSTYSQKELTMARNLGGATPIHYAAMAGSTACVELLLSVNARRVDGEKYCFDGVNEQDVDGATPLHVACAATNVDCVMYLVAANADLTLRDKQGSTPFQIACALVNEPSRSLQALHIVEKLMDAGAPVVIEQQHDHNDPQLQQNPSNALAIDCVASKAVKRELEVSFLRREALFSRTTFKRLSEQLHNQNEEVQGLQQLLTTMARQSEQTKRAARDREHQLLKQQKQIEQLQFQMKTLLQVLHSGGGFDSANHTAGAMALLSGPSQHTASKPKDRPSCGDDDPQEASTSGSDEDADVEAVRAQDAALARDLGRKCCRERQFALAETYFERSLELFPLPGVSKLLEDTRTLRSEAETPRVQPSTSHEEPPYERTNDKDADAKRLRSLLAGLAASERTKQALGRELTKLEALRGGSSEYSTALKWIEWLLALPWNKASTTPNSELLALEAAMFDEIERLESEQRTRQCHQAARVVQRAFRKRYATHLTDRAMASQRIQRSYRTFRFKRSVCERCTSASRMKSSTLPLADDTQHGESEIVGDDWRSKLQSPVFDVAVTVDPRAVLRMPKRHHVRVVQGSTIETVTLFSVLQLLAVNPKSYDENAAVSTSYYVWRRWGATIVDAPETVLCGPYEEQEAASLRYERVLRESTPANPNLLAADETVTKMEAPCPPDHVAWTSLRASAS